MPTIVAAIILAEINSHLLRPLEANTPWLLKVRANPTIASALWPLCLAVHVPPNTRHPKKRFEHSANAHSLRIARKSFSTFATSTRSSSLSLDSTASCFLLAPPDPAPSDWRWPRARCRRPLPLAGSRSAKVKPGNSASNRIFASFVSTSLGWARCLRRPAPSPRFG